MKRGWVLFLALVCLAGLCLVLPAPVLAGPGGKIASAVFRTFWGKVLLGILAVILAPWIIYWTVKEQMAVRRTLRDLQVLAKVSDEFDWLRLKERVTESFHRVHTAWRKEDMAEASTWMTDWYWQNQQMAHLDQWERDGLVNHCRVKSVGVIKPLFVRYRNEDGVLDGSRVVVSISANMEDYLAERQSGKVVEGKKGYANVETIWTFVHENGRWLVANIEEDVMSLAYAKLVNEVPAVPALEQCERMA